jgi:hypothetical protein
MLCRYVCFRRSLIFKVSIVVATLLVAVTSAIAAPASSTTDERQTARIVITPVPPTISPIPPAPPQPNPPTKVPTVTPTATFTPTVTFAIVPSSCKVNDLPTDLEMELSMPAELRQVEAAANANKDISVCSPVIKGSCSGPEQALRDRLVTIIGGGQGEQFESQEAFNISTVTLNQTESVSVIDLFDPQYPMYAPGAPIPASGVVKAADQKPAPRRTITIILYSNTKVCVPCRNLERALWIGLGKDPAVLAAMYSRGRFGDATSILRKALIDAFAKKGIDVSFTITPDGSPTGFIPHMVMNGNVVKAQDVLAALNAAQVPADPKPQPKPGPKPPSINGKCDPKEDQWGCFCIYSPPGGPYNTTEPGKPAEQRFADACLNAMGDPKQPERWKQWYNCKEIKSFAMVGSNGNTQYPGYQKWLEEMAKGPPPVKCFRGFMYSHSNGDENTVNDRTRPISQCIRVGSGIRCFSLHDCGCSTAGQSNRICNRAKAIQQELEAAGSSMVVHFDAANVDQGLPGELHRLNKGNICAANPDGNLGKIANEFNWRRVAITRKAVYIYRHKKNGTSWEWVRMSNAEFAAYCAGRIK